MYETLNDASMRLDGTIIRFKGLPIIVNGLYVKDTANGEEIVIRYNNCYGNGRNDECYLNDKNLDVSSPPLGYIPYNNGVPSCLYGVRQPARRQQQGLNPGRINLYTNGGAAVRNNNIRVEDIGAAIIGKFQGSKDYDQRWEFLQHYRAEVPFTRDIACSWTTIYYKAHSIGTIRHEDHIHIITITSPSFKLYNFEGIFGENWRID